MITKTFPFKTSVYKVTTTQGVHHIEAASAEEAAKELGYEAGKSAFVSKETAPKTREVKEPTPKKAAPEAKKPAPSKRDTFTRLAATREYVRLYGPIGKTKSYQLRTAQREIDKIEEEMRAGTYKPPPNIAVGIYEIKTQRGIKKFEAVDEDQARRKAESHGLEVSGIKRIQDKEFTPREALDRIKTAQTRSKAAAAEALITYGEGLTEKTKQRYFGEEYKPPTKDSVPIRIDRGIAYITKDTVKQLRDTSAYKQAKGRDAERLSTALTASQRDFENWLKKLKRDSPELYKIYDDKGFDALNTVIEQQQGIISKLEGYKQEQGYDITAALIEKAITPNDLKVMGFEDSDIKKATTVAKEVMDLEKGFLSRSKDSQNLTIRLALTPEPQRSTVLKESKEEKPSWLVDKTYSELNDKEKLQVLGYYESNVKPGALRVTKDYLRVRVEPIIAFTPVVGTIYYWKKMSPGWRAFSIVTDVICVGAIVRAAAASARAARGYTASARMTAARVGAGEMALAEITAPAEIAAHPIRSVKGIGKQLLSSIETVFHPKKVPLGATELTYTTARLPVDDVGDVARAMQLRDAAVDAAVHGKRATARIGDIKLTLNPTELQKVGGAIGIHATPDIRPYLNGAVVKGGAEGSGVFISPNFHSRFAQATAFGDVPEGGVKGGLIIRDKRILNALAPSGKTYMSTVEIEALLKPGTTIPPPSQVLFTRDIAGNKLTFLVIGERFTPAQVAKLKFLGSLDTVGQIFKPTMTLNRAQKASISALDDIIDLSKQRSNLSSQLNAARSAGRTATVQEFSQRITRIDERMSDLVERVNAPREVIRPRDLVWAQYTDKGLLERWGELNSRKVVRTARGNRLPTIKASREIRRASHPEEMRRVPVGMSRTPTYPHLYTPSYTPPYVPPYTPPYSPPYVPPKTPPYAPPYTPPRVPPTRPPIIPPKVPPKKPPSPPRPPSIKLGREKIPIRGQSLLSWKQGMYYVTVVEPYRTTGNKPDVIYSRHKPPWAKVVKGHQSPQKTLRAIGRRHPNVMKLPMGVVTARVKRGRVLRFSPS